MCWLCCRRFVSYYLLLLFFKLLLLLLLASYSIKAYMAVCILIVFDAMIGISWGGGDAQSVAVDRCRCIPQVGCARRASQRLTFYTPKCHPRMRRR